VLRKLRTERVGQPDATFRRLVAMLARKGYAPGLAIQIVKQALAERAESARFAEAVDVDVLEADALDGEAAQVIEGAEREVARGQ
jgi:regulatory protein